MVHFDAPSISKTEASEAQDGWASRALEGFLDAGKEALSKPGDTAIMVGSGLAAGAVIQKGLNVAEHIGGGVGTAAKVLKYSLIAVPTAFSAFRIAKAEDSATETGKMAFEMGLFLGAAKGGTYADRIPGLGRIMGPNAEARALFPRLPKTGITDDIGWSIRDNKVEVMLPNYPKRSPELPVQVHIGNERGFVATSRSGEANLLRMPEKIEGVGTLKYSPKLTTLTTETATYQRPVGYGGVHAKTNDGNRFSTSDGENFVAYRNGDSIYFQKDGSISASQSRGLEWDFRPTGEVSMRSMPSGKNRLEVDANGEGFFQSIAGSSRSIAGRVRGSNHLPLERSVTPVTYDRAAGTIGGWKVPDITPIDAKEMADLVAAKKILDALAKGV